MQTKQQPSAPQIPALIQSALKKYEQLLTSSIKSNITNLTSWFTQNAIRYIDRDIPRIPTLTKAQNVIKQNVPDPRYIHTLFLEENSVISLVEEAMTLVDIGFVLSKHLQLKVRTKSIQYSENIITSVKNKVDQILFQNKNKLESLFAVGEVQRFVQSKNNSPDRFYTVEAYEMLQIQQQILLIFSYVIKPIFQKKNFQNVYEFLYPIIFWFVSFKDNNDQKQKILVEMARKFDSFIWGRKSMTNVHLVNTFATLLDLLSLKYLKDDSFSFQTLAPLLTRIQNFPYFDLVNVWLLSHKSKKNIAKIIQNIFRNSLNTGCTIFSFELIQAFSNSLSRNQNYDVLFHLFDSFIRKEYLSIKLPNSNFVRAYMQILMLYVIGFMNRDRLDGQTQLDVLALNLQEVVCRPKFVYNSCHIQIIKFFRIYEMRFQYLSNTCRTFVTSLQQIYKVTLSPVDLHREVANRIFKNYSANYDEQQIYSLQRSHRYVGLVNLGNTCYMNSFIQALFMTKKFKSLITKTQDEGRTLGNPKLFEALVQLFRQMNSKTSEGVNQITPIKLKQQIPQPFCTSRDQHDSGQFGRIFIETLTNQLKDSPLGQKIKKLFTHEMTSRIVCRKCNRQRQRREKASEFILNINENSPQAFGLSDLLKNLFKGYELDKSNALQCDFCKSKQPAFVVPEPLDFAQYIIATISIFKYDSNGSSKINKAMNFQFNINFKNIVPKVVKEDEIYDLYAFILHIGTGVERGHYQCFARNLEENPMLWYKFDDHYVTEQEINSIQDFHFGQNQTPYILFYTNTNSNKNRKIMSSSIVK